MSLFSFGGGGEKFDQLKMKSRLKMGITRLQMEKQKISNSVKVQKREVAKLLGDQKEESARIKVEALIRDEFLIEAMELVEMFLELCVSRLALIAESKKCPQDMKEAIHTIIYVAPRLPEAKELLEIREMLSHKWGKKFIENANDNTDLAVNKRVMLKMSIKVPEPSFCIQYLKAIASENNIPWNNDLDLTVPVGVNGNQPSDNIPSPKLDNLQPQIQIQPIQIQPQIQIQPLIKPSINMMAPIQPTTTTTTTTSTTTIQPQQFQQTTTTTKEETNAPTFPSGFEIDDLQKRFDELKK